MVLRLDRLDVPAAGPAHPSAGGVLHNAAPVGQSAPPGLRFRVAIPSFRAAPMDPRRGGIVHADEHEFHHHAGRTAVHQRCPCHAQRRHAPHDQG